MILYFPVAALVTLFSNLLQHPSDLKARQDIGQINSVVQFLENLIADGAGDDHSNIRKTLAVCAEFRRIATAMLERTDKEASARRKRKTNNPEGDPKLSEPSKPDLAQHASPSAHTVTDPITGLSVPSEVSI
jgi:hypothetical protein